MTRFLPAGIFSIFVPVLRYCEKSSSVYVSFSVRRAGSQPVDTWVKSLGRFQILGFLKTPFFLLLLFFFSGSDLALRKSVHPSEVRRHVRIFLWGLRFENYGLNVGLALFSLGIQVGPAMQKNFNLSWKFFQIFRAKLKSASHFKSRMVWLG
jgi:hypothetical protein